MANSNQNNRTTAILKVTGLYLLTLLLLLFIFKGNKDVNNEREDWQKRYKDSREQNDDLKQMIITIDTITALSTQLVELEREERKNPEVTADLRSKKIMLNRFIDDLLGMTVEDQTLLENGKNIVNKLAGIRDKAKKTLNELKDLSTTTDRAIEESSDAAEGKADSEITTLASEVVKHKDEVEIFKSKSESLGTQIVQKDKDIQDLNEKITNITGRVSEISGIVEAAKPREGWLSRHENRYEIDLPNVSRKLLALRNLIEG